MAEGDEASVASGISVFFDEISRLVGEAERQYGLANRGYTEYITERLEYAITTCSDVCSHVQGVSGLEDYYRAVEELVRTLSGILRKWQEYESVIERSTELRPSTAHQLTTVSAGPGRPMFDISKEQLQYLSSLTFSWSEIASLLGVSRMTIYRYGSAVSVM